MEPTTHNDLRILEADGNERIRGLVAEVRMLRAQRQVLLSVIKELKRYAAKTGAPVPKHLL